MSQLSFFSADAVPAAVTDLAGLLAGTGQIVRRPGATRVSVVVADVWRAEAVAEMIEQAGLAVELADSDEGRPLVRTGLVAELVALGTAWTRGAVKAVPAGWTPGARALRAWALATGYPEHDGERFVLGLDSHAPDTHTPLAAALGRVGIAPTVIGARGSNPGLRIVGRRRLSKLVDYLGEPPAAALASGHWPS